MDEAPRKKHPKIIKTTIGQVDLLLKDRKGKPISIARARRYKQPLEIEIANLKRNPDKVILYENKNPIFLQIFYYKSKPYTLAIVCGNRLIAFPFDYAFIIKKALEKYIETLKR